MVDGISVADALALRNSDGMFGGSNGAWWLILLILFAGGGFNFGGNAAAQGALTRAELSEGFTMNNIERQIQGVQNGLCDGFYSMNTTNLQGFNGVNAAIANLGYQNQNCCCETNRNIDAVRYDMSRGFCDVINSQAQNTQKILDKMCEQENQNLRDQLQTANFQLSQQAQSANLINALRPFPQPAYITCSPYTTIGSCNYSSCVC